MFDRSRLDLLSSGKRLETLDVIRGVAALLVLFRHSPELGIAPSSFADTAFLFVRQIGWIGVDLFFVLSGFLIGALLFRELEKSGTIGLKRFWIRRGMKIWPSYFAAYGGCVALQLLHHGLTTNATQFRDTASNAIPNGLFLQNYLDCIPWPHSWTLAVEEHFYLLLPLLLLLLKPMLFGTRANPNRFIGVILLICLAILAMRLHNLSTGRSWKINYYRSHLRMDSLLFGVLSSWAWLRGWFQGPTRWLPWTSVFLVAAGVLFVWRYPLESGGPTSSIGFSLLFVASASLVLLAALNPQLGNGCSVWIRAPFHMVSAIGVYSYTIYLAHSIIFFVPGVASAQTQMNQALDSAGFADSWIQWLNRLLFFAASIGLGLLLSHTIERPFLRLRSWVMPSCKLVPPPHWDDMNPAIEN
ncbi:acyltransferase family protein [Stieleria varia]|uniref:O-acetyltransferase OatA n=1 Tax=Stieleria varia TaxID=2528005 RepID=A0A5C6B211_9BACT|nr:acyltransferase [Stieleria varia]TWU05948.1 O-acetyltransferase OatA [Stieleria varia]